MFNTSGIILDRSALKHNLSFLRKRFGDEVIISSVVKGNAYGHGIEQFIPMAEQCGANHFSVFNADEALRVLTAATNRPTIMIMGYLHNNELEWALRNNIEFFVFDMDRLQQAAKVAAKIEKPAKVHIELETGMNRTGFNQKELPKVAQLLKNNADTLHFRGLCTHFAGAESIANFLRVKNQKVLFRKMYRWFIKQGLKPEQCHTACSAAAIAYPDTVMDMVRIGILQYGFWPSKETHIEYLRSHNGSEVHNLQHENPLKRVISWKSLVMSTKEVATGEFIGYGTSFLAQSDMKIAIVPVGYANGFNRSLSNIGRMLIRGKRVSVVGIVNMNCMAIDVTELDEVKKGDEVVLIGKQGDLTLSVASFGELSTQLNYELLTRLPQDIPRVVVEHEEADITYPPARKLPE